MNKTNDRTDHKEWIRVYNELISGSVGGMSSMLAGHPFDTIKVLMQDASGNLPKFKSGWHALSYTVQNEGVRGIYKGMSVPMLTVSIVNSIFFASYSSCSKYLHPQESPVPYHIVAISGAVAGATISVLLAPRDLIKSKLQVQSSIRLPTSSSSHLNNHSSTAFTSDTVGGNKTTASKGSQKGTQGPISLIKNIVKREGVRGMSRGLSATLLRDIPGDMIYFTVYEYVKRHLSAAVYNQEKVAATGSPSAWVAIGAGGCAGMSYWASIYPIDVIKTKIQTQPEPAIYKGVIDCARQLYRTEGIGVFFRGFYPTILRAFPTSAANFLMYETTKSFLQSVES
ncbi:hypothetical protein SAMD00019534_074220 [Acytostelium subglobosum LB1]|uniref:hypothetical protein n=1 Tax=Acytostelium subglobosum LB1 TaxID=1410327 RepID=UPI0006449132|nr:hypothetical protein SAMD00019534_074220 [Acytostelium subglobosum LB1]GAM24247.1 hypothetical protein SAMD00019534_074220 [Acytostelium subglobosum LB1]|eukprot:XP_012752573.1 hypothetical protein SAMD00019534_074220 [Acytostelium subglobosum LB1]